MLRRKFSGIRKAKETNPEEKTQKKYHFNHLSLRDSDYWIRHPTNNNLLSGKENVRPVLLGQ